MSRARVGRAPLEDACPRHSGCVVRGPYSRGMAPRTLLTTSFWLRSARETVYALASLPLGVLWFSRRRDDARTQRGLRDHDRGPAAAAAHPRLVRVAAALERRWAELALGERLPAATARPGFRGPDAWWRRLWAARLRGSGVARGPLSPAPAPAGIVLFVAAVTIWSVALSGVTAPLWYWAVPDADFLWDGNSLDHPVEFVGAFAVGVVALLAAPWVVHGSSACMSCCSARSSGRHAGSSSVPPRAPRPDARPPSRPTRRTAAGSNETSTTERRRDWSGWPSISGARGSGSRRAPTPPRPPSSSGPHTKRPKIALTEVRDLARGIHPAILADRGLDPALSSLAARVPVPVDLSVRLQEPVPVEVEAAAYFVVSEALANAAARRRHADRGRRRTRGRRRRRSRSTMTAAAARIATAGSGLAGLRERVAALGGVLVVDSPAGGPTVVKAVISVRVVLAEDSGLLRDALTRLLGDHEIEVAAAVDDGARAPRGLRARAARRGGRRRPAAADVHRRGHSRRGRAPPRSARAPRCSCSPSTSRSGTHATC